MTNDETNQERIQACFDRIENGFNRKWDDDEHFRNRLKGKDRDIHIELTDLGSWSLVVRDGKLERIEEDDPEDADVHLTTESQHFLDVMNGDLSPMKAYLTNKINVDAGLRDILLVKSFLG